MRQALVRLVVAVAGIVWCGRADAAPFAFMAQPGQNGTVARIDLATNEATLVPVLASSPGDVGSPCTPAASTVTELADCVLDAQLASVAEDAAAEHADACALGSVAGLTGAMPALCGGS